MNKIARRTEISFSGYANLNGLGEALASDPRVLKKRKRGLR